MAEEFNAYTETVLKDVDRLKETNSLLEFTRVMAEIGPTLLRWSDKYAELRGADDETLLAVASIGKKYEMRLKEALAHQSSLKLATPGAAGGKRRKMTRRYCKKTSCRKMGFTQKASCRPYKNCYE